MSAYTDYKSSFDFRYVIARMAIEERSVSLASSISQALYRCPIEDWREPTYLMEYVRDTIAEQPGRVESLIDFFELATNLDNWREDIVNTNN